MMKILKSMKRVAQFFFLAADGHAYIERDVSHIKCVQVVCVCVCIIIYIHTHILYI